MRTAFTLVEMVVVLVILAAIASIVIAASGALQSSARNDTTEQNLTALADAAGRYLTDVTTPATTVADLLRQPPGVLAYSMSTRIGWRGPYLVRVQTGTYPNLSLPEDDHTERGFTARYGAAGDPAVLDAWEEPIVLQIPDRDGAGGSSTPEELRHARFVSAGPNGVIDTPVTDASATLPGDALFPTRAQCRDDIVLYLRVADMRPAEGAGP